MVKEVNSISFQEDFFFWTEAAIEKSIIDLKKAVSDSLPLSIDSGTLEQATSVKQIANQINAVAQKYEFQSESIRLTIPSRFSIIKKITIDDSIPEEDYPDIISFEFSRSWDESPENYHLYLPDYLRRRNGYKELLAIGLRKKVLEFFERIGEEAKIGVESISPTCFTVDEFFRTLYPDKEGQTLLVGCQRRGYDLLILDQINFLHYSFKPYSSNLDKIDQLDEEDIVSNFESVFEELQHPPVLQEPIFHINSIFFYGFHFKPNWLDLIREELNIPVGLLNFENSSTYQVKAENSQVKSSELFQFVEPISNIF
ncbi:MAG TPA: hypothetical protein ENK14_11855 [Caldithrix sp.]|nr:hypothetical protein [Caldithrix sp.]